MEQFLKIDWTPRVEDVIDDVFVDEEKFKNESVTHKILIGGFKDPFDDMYDEYEEVDIETIRPFLPKGYDNKEREDKESFDSKKIKGEQAYVPGIVKHPFKFPKYSCLTKEQQAMCLRILLRFSASEKPELSQTDREELQIYLALKEKIAKEQEEFLELAKSNWSSSKLTLVCEDYTEARWKSKLDRMKELPRYYAEAATIPFVGDNIIDLNYLCTCSKLGRIKEIKLPEMPRLYTLNVDSEQLHQMFPVKIMDVKSVPCYKLPVSQDTNCHKLAEENDIDLVISSSGLNCLANNIGPKYTKSWILPTRINSQNGKSIIYIDKPFPPTAGTIPEKNTWIFKYILKYFMVYRDLSNSEKAQKRSAQNRCEKSYDDDIFGDVTAEDLSKFEEDTDHCQIVDGEMFNTPKAKINTEEDNVLIKTIQETKDVENMECDIQRTQSLPQSTDCSSTSNNAANKKGKKKGKKKVPVSQIDDGLYGTIPDNVSYKIYTLCPQHTDQSELMKNNTAKVYKILVRSKVDGYEKSSENTKQFVKLAPKLEHQVGLGAEAVTLDEAMRQWISLTFQPNTVLERVRIWAQRRQVLQLERRTTISISNELKRLYNVRAEDCLTLLYHTIQTMKNLPPSHYIIRHTPRDGAFATVYRDTGGAGKHDVDLHAIQQGQFFTIPNAPWPLLDKLVTTPMLRCFERMPAMFRPSPEGQGWKNKYKQQFSIKGKTKNATKMTMK